MKNYVEQIITRRRIYLFGVLIFLLFLILYTIYKYILPLTFYVYEKNIYDASLFDKIRDICDNIPVENMQIDNNASGRLIYTFSTMDKQLYSLVYSPNFIKKVKELTGNQNLIPCLTVPIEYRKYNIGSYMDEHRDSQMLPDQEQYECVITLTNTSDSFTLMDKLVYTEKISSEPNSIVIVRANGIKHKVTKTTHGERTILKVVLCMPTLTN